MGVGWSQEGKSAQLPVEKPMEKPKKLPHNYKAIMQEADSPLEATSEEDLYPRLYYGVFLSHKRKVSPSSNRHLNANSSIFIFSLICIQTYSTLA